MAIDLTILRADTSAILDDWTETVAFQRSTDTTIAGAAGETTQAWATALSTGCDVQAMPPRSASLRTLGGEEYRPELRVILRHGSDVRVGDRFAFSTEVYHVMAVPTAEEDKVIAFAARKGRDDG